MIVHLVKSGIGGVPGSKRIDDIFKTKKGAEKFIKSQGHNKRSYKIDTFELREYYQ